MSKPDFFILPEGGVGVGVSVGGGRKAYSSSSHHRRGTSFIHVTKEAMQKMHQSESSVRGMGKKKHFAHVSMLSQTLTNGINSGRFPPLNPQA